MQPPLTRRRSVPRTLLITAAGRRRPAILFSRSAFAFQRKLLASPPDGFFITCAESVMKIRLSSWLLAAWFWVLPASGGVAPPKDDVSSTVAKIAEVLRFEQKCRALNESALKEIRPANPTMLDEDFSSLTAKVRAADYASQLEKRWRVAFSPGEWAIIDAYVSKVGAREIAAVDAVLTEAAQTGKDQAFLKSRFTAFYESLDPAEREAIRDFRTSELGRRFVNLVSRVGIDISETANAVMGQAIGEVDARRRELWEAERAAAKLAASKGAADVVLDVRDVDVSPWGGIHEAPELPADLPRRKERVVVVLSYVITKTGSTSDVTVKRSSDARYNDACIAAIRRWTFEPAKKSGAPVACRVETPLGFSPE